MTDPRKLAALQRVVSTGVDMSDTVIIAVAAALNIDSVEVERFVNADIIAHPAQRPKVAEYTWRQL